MLYSVLFRRRPTSTPFLAAEALGQPTLLAAARSRRRWAGSARLQVRPTPQAPRGRIAAFGAPGGPSGRSSSPTRVRPSRCASGLRVARPRRRRALGRGRVRARPAALRPRDQHRGAHRDTAGFQAALPHAYAVVRSGGGEHEIDQAILFGLARQESRFAFDLVSSAGAMGLMQLMPPTARWSRSRWAAATTTRPDHRTGDQHPVRGVLFQVLAGPPGTPPGARRRRVQRGTEARAGWRAGARSRARSGSRPSRSTRRATT